MNVRGTTLLEYISLIRLHPSRPTPLPVSPGNTLKEIAFVHIHYPVWDPHLFQTHNFWWLMDYTFQCIDIIYGLAL